MEKYYIAQLEASSLNHDGRDDTAVAGRKLVGLQFARKPPTFGVLYLVNSSDMNDRSRLATGHDGYSDSQSDDDQEGDQDDYSNDDGCSDEGTRRRGNSGLASDRPVGGNQSLKLATLDINGDNSAKFNISHEIHLTEVARRADKQGPHQQQRQHQVDKVVDFSALNDQLLLEISHSNTTIEQQLQSSCFILTQRGDLCVVSLIEPRGAKFLLNCTELANDSSNSGRGKLSSTTRSQERFMEFKVIRRPAEEAEGEDSEAEGEDSEGEEEEEEKEGGEGGEEGTDDSNASKGGTSAHNRGESVSSSGDRLADQNRSYCTLSAHLLSNKSYYYCSIVIRNTKLDCDVKLLSQYSLRKNARLATKTEGRSRSKMHYSTTTPDPAASAALKFVQLLPIESRRHKSVVLLKLSDGTERIVKQSKCLHSTTVSTGAPTSLAGQCLVLTPSSLDQAAILLSYSGHKLVASSLFISHSGRRRRRNNHEHGWQDRARARPRSGDPDGLLPTLPSFELEQCWSIDLSQIEGIRSALLEFDDDDDDNDSEHEGHADDADDGSGDNDGAGGHWSSGAATGKRSSRGPEGASLHGCLCPMWTGDVAFKCDPDDLFGDKSSRCWPNYLLLAYGHHVLIYCFEQLNIMPFSIVYDRAFLQLDSSSAQTAPPRPGGDKSQTSQTSQQQQQQMKQQVADKSVDLRVKPKLVHNFKLIGSAPSDSLFNMLFLTQRVHLHQLRCCNQLGLLVSLTQLNHVLVFKLISASIVKHKDNLYQQALLGSIRANSLLSDELQRIQAANLSLRHKLASLASENSTPTTARISTPTGPLLSAGPAVSSMMSLMQLSSGVEAKQRAALDCNDAASFRGNSVEQLIRMSLKPSELYGGLYSIQLEWLSSIGLKRLIILSTVNSRILAPGSAGFNSHSDGQLGPSIKSFKADNFDEDGSDGDRGAGGASAKTNGANANRALFLSLELEAPESGEPTESAKLVADEEGAAQAAAGHKLRHLDCSATKVWAIIELNPAKFRNKLADGPDYGSSPSGLGHPFTSTSLAVPILLTDGQFGGKLSVYFVFKSTGSASVAAGHLQHTAAGHVNQYYRDHMAHMQLQHQHDTHDNLAPHEGRNHRLTSNHHGERGGINVSRQQLLPNRFHRLHVAVKPLQSYRASRHLDADSTTTTTKTITTPGSECEPCRLELDGTFSDEQVFGWLNECLDIDGVRKNLQNQMQARLSGGAGGGGSTNASDFRLRFSSNFTHCFIDIQIGTASGNAGSMMAATESRTQGLSDNRLAANASAGAASLASWRRQKASKLTIISDDFIALNLIEKLVFTEATNESIVLIKTNRQSPANIDNLRHLIGRQKINIDLYLCRSEKSPSLFPLRGDGQLLEGNGTRVGVGSNLDGHRQGELLLDSLLSETDLQDMAIEPELKQSTNWLERSLRLDIERVLVSQYDDNKENSATLLSGRTGATKSMPNSSPIGERANRAKSGGHLGTLIDIVCGYIIDALVDYDSLHSIKSTSATLIAMRSRLFKLIEQTNEGLMNQKAKLHRRFDATLSQQQFASQVLAEWAKVKRTKKLADGNKDRV